MIAPDSSVLIAGSDPAHLHHEVAGSALSEVRQSGRAIAHTLAETFAVLTGAAYGRAPERVMEYLGQFLRQAPVGISPDRQASALEELSRSGVIGGAVYDGLIAMAARDAEVVLVSLDARATTTYQRCGVEFHILSAGDR